MSVLAQTEEDPRLRLGAWTKGYLMRAKKIRGAQRTEERVKEKNGSETKKPQRQWGLGFFELHEVQLPWKPPGEGRQRKSEKGCGDPDGGGPTTQKRSVTPNQERKYATSTSGYNGTQN